MPEIQGTTAPGFEALKAAFAEGQANDPGGAQLSVYRDGEQVVDLWTAERGDGTGPYAGDTPTVLMSCSKAITVTCVLRLAERGLIDIDAPVARYWPEFAAGGKGDLTVVQVLSHTSGLSAFDPDDAPELAGAFDWEGSTARLAAMTPLWPPGEACAYHAVTIGFLLGELVRRVTGKSVGAMIAEEIAGPLGVDLWLGLPKAQEGRIAQHFRTTPRMTMDTLSQMFGAVGLDLTDRYVRATLIGFTAVEDLMDAMNKPSMHAVEVPAGNAIGSARALSKFYAALIGEVDGVRLLSPETIARARASITDDLGAPEPMKALTLLSGLRYGLGFNVPTPLQPMLGGSSFGHYGAGGRVGFAVPDKNLAVAYVCNSLMGEGFSADPRWGPWTQALEQAVM